jgi:hypothetical protein
MNDLGWLPVSISPSKAHDRAKKAAAAVSRSFLDQAGGDRDLAERLRREHFSELGRRSGSRRRAKAAERRAEDAARRAAYFAELEAAGVRFTSEAELAELLGEPLPRPDPTPVGE